MAGRRSQTRVRADVDEVFTDLAGVVDTKSPDRDAADLQDLDSELTLSAAQRSAQELADADLEVVDEAAEVEETAELEEVVEEEDDAGEGAAEEGEILFDPRDVQVITASFEAITAREQNATATQTRAKSDIEAANAALEAALEAGDTKANVKATNALADAKVALQMSTGDLASIAQEKQQLAGRAQKVIDAAPKDAAGRPIIDKVVRAQGKVSEARQSTASKLAPQFLKHNPWFTDPKHATTRAILHSLDADLAKEKKLDKNSAEYFTELGRRFNKVKPGLFKTPDGKMIATGTRQRAGGPLVPSGGGGGGNPPPTGSDVRLTNEDLGLMRTFGMDPDNKNQRRQWLATKRELAADEKRKAA